MYCSFSEIFEICRQNGVFPRIDAFQRNRQPMKKGVKINGPTCRGYFFVDDKYGHQKYLK